MNIFLRKIPFTLSLIFSLGLLSCVKNKDLYKPNINQPDDKVELPTGYLYPFAQEGMTEDVEITLTLDPEFAKLPQEELLLDIPALKYNKSILFMLTQDDCRHSAFCRTWSAINGRPITRHQTGARSYYYDIEQLEAGDLPPETYGFGKTLGSTDGFGNEVRFHFTTTVAPEWDYMYAGVEVDPGLKSNYNRFFMKSGLRWNNVREMLNYGTSVAFHDLKTEAVQVSDSLVAHFRIAQDISKKALDGRGIKFLAEPNGNKTYLQAGLRFSDIQTMTAQTGTSRLIPAQLSTDLTHVVLPRVFVSSGRDVRALVLKQAQAPYASREVVHVGVHETDDDYAQLLLWLNEHYGKEGSDELWFPSQEEYYEYTYYREHCTWDVTRTDNIVTIKIKFPNRPNFYYPSLTFNLPGIPLDKVTAVSSNDVVKGMSYGAHNKGISFNIDCRKYLYEHADHYVKKYQESKTAVSLQDARYFVGMLKESTQKTDLLEKLK